MIQRIWLVTDEHPAMSNHVIGVFGSRQSATRAKYDYIKKQNNEFPEYVTVRPRSVQGGGVTKPTLARPPRYQGVS